MTLVPNPNGWRGKQPEKPFITVITATLNAATQLPPTLASLRAQTNANFEWLVADGGSSDRTCELLAQHEEILRWISAPDRGLYDAWNRACTEARGEWLLFLGAGDELSDSQILDKITPYLLSARPDHVLVYGQLLYLSAGQRQPLELVKHPWSELSGRWEIGRPALPPHGATFQHRSLVSTSGAFDTDFRIAADSEFMLRALRLGSPMFVPLTIAHAPIGGVSFTLDASLQIQREVLAINKKLGLHPPFSHRVLNTFVLRGKLLAGMLLPQSLNARLIDIVRKFCGKPKRWTVP
jgi:glycosyltransferase involved in cell wall biosynthesis